MMVTQEVLNLPSIPLSITFFGSSGSLMGYQYSSPFLVTIVKSRNSSNSLNPFPFLPLSALQSRALSSLEPEPEFEFEDEEVEGKRIRLNLERREEG